jgi:Immunoglobulin I-set domain
MRNLLLFSVILVCASQKSFAELQIVRQPQNQIVWSGAQASFSVAAKGAKKITYQWQKDGVNLPSLTKNTLRIKTATPADWGEYSFLVSSGSTILESETGTLVVQNSFRADIENFENPDSTKGILAGSDTGLYSEISSGKLRFQY